MYLNVIIVLSKQPALWYFLLQTSCSPLFLNRNIQTTTAHKKTNPQGLSSPWPFRDKKMRHVILSLQYLQAYNKCLGFHHRDNLLKGYEIASSVALCLGSHRIWLPPLPP